MKTPLRILHLEDDPVDAELIRETLETEGFTPEITVVQTEADYVAQLDQDWDIILVDYNLPQFDGMKAIKLVKERGLDLSIILISGTIGEDVAVTAMRAGASDYVMKDHLKRLGTAVKRGLTETIERRERKQVAAAQEKLKEQLNHARKMEAVGCLAGGVAHEFNNKLQVIFGFTELAMDKAATNESIQNCLKEIYNAAKHSAEITSQLLAHARQQPAAPKEINLNESMGSMLKMLQHVVGENITSVWTPGTGLWPVWIDPTQLDQILVNLCTNARDAIEEVGQLTIKTKNIAVDEAFCPAHTEAVPGDYVLLAVSDTGCGMNEETLKNVFEPFFSTKGVGKGTGLGLATVYGIVKQNNGFITINSEPDQGSTFKIYLPRHTGGPGQKQASHPANVSLGHGETILVVEDDLSILDMARLFLEDLGYRVLTAGTPNKALQTAVNHSGKIDMLLTDVIMPEMNGPDLDKQLVTLYPDLKLLFMSGYTTNTIVNQGVLDSDVHFIQKPFSSKDLAAKVRQALNE